MRVCDVCVLCSSLCDLSGSFDASSDSHMTDRRDRSVLLSPTVLIGPSDAVLNQPIKIKLPHCLSYQNNSWHLQVCILTHHPPSHITHPHTSHSYNHASLILAHAYPQLVLALILPPLTSSQVYGRPHESDEDNWTEITNTMGLVDLPNKKHTTHFNSSAFQLHLDYVTVSCSIHVRTYLKINFYMQIRTINY